MEALCSNVSNLRVNIRYLVTIFLFSFRLKHHFHAKFYISSQWKHHSRFIEDRGLSHLAISLIP